jgi:DNA-binding response OmpR family regulator
MPGLPPMKMVPPLSGETLMSLLQAIRPGTAILVVDDDADIREVLTYKLQAAGYPTLTAGDGPAALELAERHRPRMILLDIALPGMDGLDVCRGLQASPRTAGIPVLMVSARSDAHDIDLGFALGADDYITKPFSPRELLRRVSGLLSNAPAW